MKQSVYPYVSAHDWRQGLNEPVNDQGVAALSQLETTNIIIDLMKTIFKFRI